MNIQYFGKTIKDIPILPIYYDIIRDIPTLHIYYHIATLKRFLQTLSTSYSITKVIPPRSIYKFRKMLTEIWSHSDDSFEIYRALQPVRSEYVLNILGVLSQSFKAFILKISAGDTEEV